MAQAYGLGRLLLRLTNPHREEQHHGNSQSEASQGREKGPQGSEYPRRVQVDGAQKGEAQAVMATPPQVAPQAAPPPQGGGGSATPTGQILQLVAIISKASDQLAKVFPASTPMSSAIQDQLQQIQSKISETQSPQQPQAPPI
jgi:hypothetical protein